MAPRTPANRITEKAGVNAARTLFEASGYVFQEVDLQNDFGKDAYVDLVDDRDVTGLCIALQIKSGPSYRRASGYSIPIDQHYSIWRGSSLPLAGIVFDPELNQLFWCNISDFLESNTGSIPSSVPIGREMVLDRVSLEAVFKPAMKRTNGRRSVGNALLRLCSENESDQIDALMDCFAVGRTDPRALVLLRYLLNLLVGRPLQTAIHILSHATGHPDILWIRDKNWIPDAACDVIKSHFRWSDAEVRRLFQAVSPDSWHRGGLGQSLYMILREEPALPQKIEEAAISFLDSGIDDHAFAALNVVLCRSKDAKVKYESLVASHPRFRELSLSTELEYVLGENDELYLFD